jgi:hypothetical protein
MVLVWKRIAGDARHVAGLFGLKHLLKRAGDKIGAQVAEACARELRARSP